MSGFRSQTKFEKFETDEPVESVEDAFNGALGELEKRGLDNSNGEPPVTIILNNSTEGSNGRRLTHAIVYIGATPEEVIDDQLLTQKRP